jgi:hypothetical protein
MKAIRERLGLAAFRQKYADECLYACERVQ